MLIVCPSIILFAYYRSTTLNYVIYIRMLNYVIYIRMFPKKPRFC